MPEAAEKTELKEDQEKTTGQRKGGIARARSLGNIAAAGSNPGDKPVSGENPGSLRRFGSDTNIAAVNIVQNPLTRSEGHNNLFSTGTETQEPVKESAFHDNLADAAGTDEKEMLLTALKAIKTASEKEYERHKNKNKIIKNLSGRGVDESLKQLNLEMELGSALGDKNTSVAALKELYKKAQQQRIEYLKNSGNIVEKAPDAAGKGKSKNQDIKEYDMSERALRLAALFESGLRKSERFSKIMKLLSKSTLDMEALDFWYEMIRGRKLKEEMANHFGRDSAEFSDFKQRYNTGITKSDAKEAKEKQSLLAALKQIQPGLMGEYMAHRALSPTFTMTGFNEHRKLMKKLDDTFRNEEKADAETLRQLYGKVQQARIHYVKDPVKLFDAASGSRSADRKAHKIAKGDDIDYRLVRLAALFERNDNNIWKTERFAALMNWLSASGLDKKELEYRYELIRERRLEEDLKNTFGENPLQYQFLKQLYEEGSISKTAELALELGLLYEGKAFGPNMTHKMNYERVRDLIKDAPESFTFLTKDDAPVAIFEREAYNYLKNKIPGFFNELRGLVNSLMAVSEKKSEYTPDPEGNEIKTGNKHADYLISMVINAAKGYKEVEVPEGGVLQSLIPLTPQKKKTIREYNYREFEKHKVTSMIFAWAAKSDEHNNPAGFTDRATPLEELDKFVKSGAAFTDKKPIDSPYTKVWEIMSDASQLRFYWHRKLDLKFFGGFSEERLKFIHEWVRLTYEQRKKEDSDEQKIKEQAASETEKVEKLIAKKEAAEKEIKALKDKKDPESTEKKKKATQSLRAAEKEMEPIDLEIRKRTEEKAFSDAIDNFRLKKLDLLLEKHSTRWVLSKKQERTNFKRKVLNLLSSSKKWDAQLALIKYYMPEKWAKYEAAAVMEDYDSDDKPISTIEVKNIFEKKDRGRVMIASGELKNDLSNIFNILGPKLRATGLEEHQVAQIKGMVLHKGAFENKAAKETDEALNYPESEKIDKEYNTANYQKLKKEARKNGFKTAFSQLDAGKAVDLLLKPKPDTLEQHLMLNDPEIADYIKNIAKIRLNSGERADNVIKALELLRKNAVPPTEGVKAAFDGLEIGQEVVITAKDMKEIIDEKKNKEKYLKARGEARARGKSETWWEAEILKREMKEPIKEYKELSDFREKLWKRDAKKAGAIEDEKAKLKDLKESFEDWVKEQEASGSDNKKETAKALKETMESIAAMQEQGEAWKEATKETLETEATKAEKELEDKAKMEKEMEALEETGGIKATIRHTEHSIMDLVRRYSKKKDPETRNEIEELEKKLKALRALQEDRNIASPEKRTLARTQRIQQEVQEELNKDSTEAYRKEKKNYEKKYMRDKKDKVLALPDKEYAAQKLNRFAATLSLQYHSEREFHDRNRFLEIAFKAQQEEVNGKQLGEKLREIDKKAYTVITASRDLQTVGEQRAVATLNAFFEKNEKITLKDVLKASAGRKGTEKFSSDTNALKFAVDELTEDELLTTWVGDSIKALQEKAHHRFISNLYTHPGGNADAAMREESVKETEAILNFPIIINPELEALLHEVAKNENAVFETKRKIFEKVGKSFQDNKAEEIYKLKLGKLEKQQIGLRLMAENNLKAYKQTQTGANWHLWDAAGLAASGAETNLLNALWQEQPGSGEAYDSKEESLKNIRKLLKKAEIATDKWRDTQDQLNKQVVSIVTNILSIIVASAGMATGQMYAPIAVKIVWAVVHKAIEQTIKTVMDHAMGREGEQDYRDVLKDSSIKILTAIINTAVASDFKEIIKGELLPYKDHQNYLSLAAAIKTGFALPKKEVSALISKTVETIIETGFKKSPDLWTEAKDHFSKMPDSLIKTAAEASALSFGKLAYITAHPYIGNPGDPGATKRPKEFMTTLSPEQKERFVQDMSMQQFLLKPASNIVGDTAALGFNAAKAMLGESAAAKEDKKKVKPMEPDWDTRMEKYGELYNEYNPSKKEEVAGTVMRDLMDELGWSVNSELKKSKDILEELEKGLELGDRQKLKPVIEKRAKALFEGLEKKFPHYKDRLTTNKTEIIKKLKDFGEEKK